MATKKRNTRRSPKNTTVSAAYRDTEEELSVAEETGARELTLENAVSLEELPASIGRLTRLRKLDLSITPVKDLKPLAELTQLEALHLNSYCAGSLDLAPLSDLTNLRHLTVGGGGIRDISAIAGLTNLTSLSLTHSDVKCVDAIARLVNLEVFEAVDTALKDLSPISDLRKIHTLNLSRTNVSDLGSLSRLKNLSMLELVACKQVQNINPLADLVELRSLKLSQTKVCDIAALASLSALEILDLDYTRVVDIEPLRELYSLVWLSLRGTPIRNIKAMRRLMGLEHLWLSETKIFDLSPLEDLPLEFLDVSGTKVKDLRPVAKMTSLSESVLDGGPQGLRYKNTPASTESPLRVLSRMEEPSSTIETINYLRETQGLPRFVPELYEAPPDVEEYVKGLRQPGESQSPPDPLTPLQGPTAATRFFVSDGKIDLVPSDAWRSHHAQASTYHLRARQLAVLLNERLQRTDAVPDAAGAVAALLRVLGDDIGEVQPDQLRLAWRSIAARARAYGHPSSQNEISVESVSALYELSDVLVDLQSFARSDVEANELAIRKLDLTAAQASSAKVILDEIVEAFSAAPEVVKGAAQDTLNAAAIVSATATDEDAKLAIEAERILTVENLALAIARHLSQSQQSSTAQGRSKSLPRQRKERVRSLKTPEQLSWDDFSDRFLQRISKKGPDQLADATIAAGTSAIKGLPKSISALGGVLLISLMTAPWITACGGLAISLGWIGYELRKRNKR